MSLLGLFDRSVDLHLLGVGSLSSNGPSRGHQARPSLQPALIGLQPTAANLDVARFLTKTLLADAHTVRAAVAELEAALDENVITWSPAMHTTSRTALVSALLDGDDALSDIEISIDREGFGGASIFVLWSFTARFSRPGLLNDDVLIEPSYRSIKSAGVLVTSFRAGASRAVRIDCFYDGVSLLEQVLSGAAPKLDAQR